LASSETLEVLVLFSKVVVVAAVVLVQPEPKAGTAEGVVPERAAPSRD
jgi:hypothetical protein